MQRIRLMHYAAEWGAEVWDTQYSKADLKLEQVSRRNNIEYFEMLDRALAATGLDKRKDKASLKICELACGTGPLGAHLIDKGFNVEFSDISPVLLERLEKEFGYKTFVSTCWDMSEIPNETYDVVLLAGTVYNSEEYFRACRAYAEIERVLKPGGVFIHYLNHYKSAFAAARFSPICAFLERVFTLRIITENETLRRLLGKKLFAWRTKYWLYSANDIREMMTAMGFDVKEISMMEVEVGLRRILPFFTFLIKKEPLGKVYDYQDYLYLRRKDMLPAPVLWVTETIRRRWPNLCAKSLGVWGIKPLKKPAASAAPAKPLATVS